MSMQDINDAVDNFDLGEQRDTGVMLLAALEVGPDEQKVAEFTGIPLDYIRPRAERLRANGVWKNGKTHCEWFAKDGGVAFVMDVCVAEGLMGRTKPKRSKVAKATR